ILSAPRTVLTPHLGARTPGSLARMEAVIDEVLGILEGKEPRHAVDLPDPKEE
ncbi:MAG: hydroxyacid dehydrogenase, partial [Planctomycetota bacterium]